MADLAQLLLEAGLIQFGSFVVGDRTAPYQLHLELLPSYPDILEWVIDAVAARVGAVDQLLCSADAVPVGVGVGLKLRLPLVYSRGSHEPAVSDLVGAYDIGHRAAFITTALQNVERTSHLVAGARRVGLDTRQLISVIDSGVRLDSLPFESLLRLADVVDDLASRGLLPEGQARAVHDWMTGT